MKLNCDMGESFGSWTMGRDAEVMPHIDMANIACGFHASDPLTMDTTVKLAVEHSTEIGAHPGYPDLLGFGRRDMAMSEAELKSMLVYQIAALDGVCRVNGGRVTYVKPHGALYNCMMRDSRVLSAVITAVADYDRNLALVALANDERENTLRLADLMGIEVRFEAFADRAYDARGCLAPRSQAGAVLHDPADIEQQVMMIVEEGKVRTLDGELISLRADTVCVHGDNEQAVASVRNIRRMMNAS